MNIREMISYVEKFLNPGTKIVLGLVAVVAIIYSIYASTQKTTNVTSPTVMITNMAGNSGGSGVVVNIGENTSMILTNAHVCHVVENGGKVITTYGETHLVVAYKKYWDHDLCALVIAAALKNKAKIAPTKPTLYAPATISGHPNLLPNIVSTGHFSGTKVIEVFTGIKPCTPEQEQDVGMICAFFNGMPEVKSYEAEVVTSLIMAGSSGSAVYNDNQELSGLAFAGAGELSYAFTVPYAYVIDFLSKVNNNGTWERPDYRLNVVKLLLGDRQRKENLVRKCETDVTVDANKEIKKLCSIITDTLKWQK